MVDRPVINDEFRKTPLLVVYDRARGTARAWERTVDGRALEFEPDLIDGASGQTAVRDIETGSTWSWLEGRATDGELAGTELRPVTHHPILNRRFRGFYPEGPIYQ